MSALTSAHATRSPPSTTSATGTWLLPYTLRPSTLSVEDAIGDPDPAKLFNGSPASFADIRAGLTFSRDLESRIVASIMQRNLLACTLIGVGGVGKTTLARRVLFACHSRGCLAWEHNSNFPLRSQEWFQVAESLKTQGRKGILLVDNSPSFQRQVNTLIDRLHAGGETGLQLLLVGERSAWLPRKKSAVIFSDRGEVFTLSRLENADIERLVYLARDKSEIHRLVEPSFAALSSQDQISRLKNRCSSEMYVSLKHVFGSENLDVIILQEFAQLAEDHREVYRTVAALEASGTRVHRQLVIKILGIESHILRSMLQVLEGVVDEYTISEKDGLYGWRTRHEVIARALAKFKFAEDEELFNLLQMVIDQLNPSLWIERQTIIDLCNADYGIRRVADEGRRTELYRKLVLKAPGERVPRHRLISELMRRRLLDEADVEIRQAQDSVGLDSPIHRFKTQLLVRRAQGTQGLLLEDRRAFLLEALRLASNGIKKYTDDKYAYFVFGEVADAFVELDNDPSYLDQAIEKLRAGFEKILDPDLSERLREFIQRRNRLGAAPFGQPAKPSWNDTQGGFGA
jgi:hypothetical protein